MAMGIFVSQRFRHRREAGELLARRLNRYAGDPNTIVLALPRGGVPAGLAVAEHLRLPLEVFQVRKLGVPGREELAMGAVGSGGGCYLNYDVIDTLHIDRAEIDAAIASGRAELERRERLYHGDRASLTLINKRIILVDDGIATGSTMFAAIDTLRSQHVKEIVVGIPVGPLETCEQLRAEADEVVCLRTPEPFYAVGTWYQDFQQVGDAEVKSILDQAAARTLP
jgi:putative phosphoribosyl transferase